MKALAVSGSDLYAGGYFTNAGGSTANCIAKWNGSSWSPMNFGMGTGGDAYWYPYVYALAVSGGNVYAGGIFITAGKSGASYIAKWQGSSWTALGSGMNGEVEALAASGSDLYAGGYFTTASGASAVAEWNGSSWTTLGAGIAITSPRSPVLALATSGSDLYVGGSFTNAGGIAASNIAKWNGSTWSALGSGMNGDVYALAVSGSNLYAGGSFTMAGGIVANNIAKWDGSSWSALDWMGGYVEALAVSGSDLYAGGGFTFTNGGNAFNFIAKWDGSTWSGLGGGMDYIVRALAVSGSNLYAGGQFTMAGGAPASYIAKWDGTSWSAMGSGLSAPAGDPYYGVYSLAVSGGDLYAGGEFTMAGGIPATNIAKWDGSNWSALGSGMGPASPNMPPYVLALAASGSDLYAGGLFTTAGGKVSSYVARAYVLPLPSLSVFRSGANVTVSWPSPDTAGFALEQSVTLLPSTWLPSSAHVADDGTNKSVTIPATNNAQFFRLRAP